LRFQHNMKRPRILRKMPSATLNNLLIEEIKRFITSLNDRSIEDLEEVRSRFKQILALLREEQRKELEQAYWGKDSTLVGEK
jgi:hypothetical protein